MKKTKINKIDVCPLDGGDYIVSINVLYTNDELKKLGIKTKKDIVKYINNKLDQENSRNVKG